MIQNYLPWKKSLVYRKKIKLLGENLSLGFRFRYGFGENLGIHGLLISQFRHLQIGKKSAQIRVSNNPIWGKGLVFKKVNVCKHYNSTKFACKDIILSLLEAFVHILTSLTTWVFLSYRINFKDNDEPEEILKIKLDI